MSLVRSLAKQQKPTSPRVGGVCFVVARAHRRELGRNLFFVGQLGWWYF